MDGKAYEQGKVLGYSQGCGVATAAHWSAYCRTLDNKPEQGWILEGKDFERGFVDGVAQWKAEHPYSVLGFESHPDDDNDDVLTSDDFATIEEARAAFLGTHEREVAYVMIDGPDVNEVRKNPAHRPSRRRADDDGEWQREIAMQAGMGLGVRAYNDEMGYCEEMGD